MQVIRNSLLYGADDKPMLYDIHFLKNQVKKTVIIYVHGFNGFKDWGNFDLIANHFASAGFFFVKMNLSHNGTTTDKPEDFTDLEAYSENNYTKELADIEKVIDWVCNKSNAYTKEFNPDKIVLLGHSRGGGISMIKASEDQRVKGLITWAAVGECKTPWGSWNDTKMKEWQQTGITHIENKRTRQLLPLKYQLYEDYKANEDRFNIKRAIKRLSIPVQICHGTQDEAVPYSTFLKFKIWKPKAEYVSVNSNHVFDRKHPYTEDFIPAKCMMVIEKNIDFLKKNHF